VSTFLSTAARSYAPSFERPNAPPGHPARRRKLWRVDGPLADDEWVSWSGCSGRAESPREKMLLNSGGLAKKAREGVGQVRSWRDYLSKNLSDARKPTSEGGLELAGLRPDKARGLVIIGRREETLGLRSMSDNNSLPTR
jgi:hypothetical protein